MNFLYKAVMAVAFMFGMSVLALIVIGPAVFLYDRTGNGWYLLLMYPCYWLVEKALSFILK